MLILCCVLVGAMDRPIARFSTFAGNGRAGIADGPRKSAEFILPSALATDSAGNLFVADAAAQRIRVVRANGLVETLAGSGPVNRSGLWVTPGFKDGPALQARFNRPSGIAVGADGRVYVSDTYNHCVRSISNGLVSTYAGLCGRLGARDGSRADATFSYPRQLAIASDGTLYVADFQAGIRKISTTGSVATLPLAVDKRVSGISITQAGDIVIADVGGLLYFNQRTGETRRIPSFDLSQAFPPTVSGGMELGVPFALAAEGSGDAVFFTDLRSDSVRYFDTNGSFLEYVNGAPREDAVIGSPWQSESLSVLHGPMGLAIDRSGSLFVADSGHKRIVKFDHFDRDPDRGFVDPSALLQLHPNHAEYRILIIGNSFAWFGNQRDSIGAHIEDTLRKDGALAAAGRVPRVLTVLTPAGTKGQASLAKELVANSQVDFVVIFANEFDMEVFLPNPNWATLFHDMESQTVDALNQASLKSAFVVIPTAYGATPLELLYLSQDLTPDESDYETAEPLLTRELQSIGPPVINLFPLVRDYEAGPFVQPLYGNEDPHPTAYARRLFADYIARQLERLRPWSEHHG